MAVTPGTGSILAAPIRFPKSAATTVNAAMDQLFSVFPDHYPVLLGEDETHWILGRTWPADPSWYVDPDIEEQARRLFDSDLPGIARYWTLDVVVGVPVLFTMFHSWALLAPALALTHGAGRPTTIVHVDDHADSMPVLLKAERDGWRLSTSGARLDLDDPQSVEQAVTEGVASIGNFLTAYMLGTPSGRFVHVKAGFAEVELPLNRVTTEVLLAGSKFEAVSLEPDDAASLAGGWTMSQVSRLPLNLAECDAVVWLDIDLDGFCNRYDGDSDRRSRPGTESERISTRRNIESFLSRLREATWRGRIGVVSIAASPGFFPSDLWEEMVPLVRSGIADVLAASTR